MENSTPDQSFPRWGNRHPSGMPVATVYFAALRVVFFVAFFLAAAFGAAFFFVAFLAVFFSAAGAAAGFFVAVFLAAFFVAVFLAAAFLAVFFLVAFFFVVLPSPKMRSQPLENSGVAPVLTIGPLILQSFLEETKQLLIVV